MIDEVMAEVMIQAASNIFLEIVHVVNMFCSNARAADFFNFLLNLIHS